LSRCHSLLTARQVVAGKLYTATSIQGRTKRGKRLLFHKRGEGLHYAIKREQGSASFGTIPWGDILQVHERRDDNEEGDPQHPHHIVLTLTKGRQITLSPATTDELKQWMALLDEQQQQRQQEECESGSAILRAHRENDAGTTTSLSTSTSLIVTGGGREGEGAARDTKEELSVGRRMGNFLRGRRHKRSLSEEAKQKQEEKSGLSNSTLISSDSSNNSEDSESTIPESSRKWLSFSLRIRSPAKETVAKPEGVQVVSPFTSHGMPADILKELASIKAGSSQTAVRQTILLSKNVAKEEKAGRTSLEKETVSSPKFLAVSHRSCALLESKVMPEIVRLCSASCIHALASVYFLCVPF